MISIIGSIIFFNLYRFHYLVYHIVDLNKELICTGPIFITIFSELKPIHSILFTNFIVKMLDLHAIFRV